MDSTERDRVQIAVTAAAEKARAHVEAQRGVPVEILPHLEAAATQFWANDGMVLPIVLIDGGEQTLVVPGDKDVLPFIHDCLVRLGKRVCRVQFHYRRPSPGGGVHDKSTGTLRNLQDHAE